MAFANLCLFLGFERLLHKYLVYGRVDYLEESVRVCSKILFETVTFFGRYFIFEIVRRNIFHNVLLLEVILLTCVVRVFALFAFGG